MLSQLSYIPIVRALARKQVFCTFTNSVSTLFYVELPIYAAWLVEIVTATLKW